MRKIEVGENIFEVVDHFPLGYEIWNIGTNMAEGYLPLCRLSSRQPFPGARNIETDTLKAVKTDGAREMLDVAGFGIKTLQDAEAFVKRYARAKPGTIKHEERGRVKKALPYMRKVFKNI